MSDHANNLNPDYVTPVEAAGMLGISVNSIYYWCTSGWLKHERSSNVKFGRYTIPTTEILAIKRLKHPMMSKFKGLFIILLRESKDGKPADTESDGQI